DTLQSDSSAQRDRLRRATRQTGRPRRGDLGAARSETGGGAETTATAASAGWGNPSRWPEGPRDWFRAAARTELNWPGETEAGNAGEQPCRGITWWAHRVDEVGGVGAARLDAPVPHFVLRTSSNDRPLCLENSRRQAAELRSYPKSAILHFRPNQ